VHYFHPKVDIDKMRFTILFGTVCHALAFAFQPLRLQTSVGRSGGRVVTADMVAPRIPDTTKPLSPETFAGMVENRLLERFDESKIQRVLASWRLLDQDYEHNEYVGQEGQEGSSDMIQECHSYVPGLPVKNFWNAQDFDWIKYLERNYKSIRKEFLAVTADMQQLQKQGNNIWAGALTEDASSYGIGWRTLVLMNRGRWDPVNANLFPTAAKAVHDSGVPVTEVFFASMDGPSSIEKHSDFTNFVLTSHLAIEIPCNGQNKCRLTVGDETREWLNGNAMVFDTSLLHDAVNESDQMRYILMMRIWHPDLTETERQALQFTYDCLEVPGLVSPDPGERFMADRLAESMHAFPELQTKPVQGFGSKKSNGKKNKGVDGGTAKGFGI
jgi:aspartyl/asparaginyl beta-hydroxylase (cupin superfamily)